MHPLVPTSSRGKDRERIDEKEEYQLRFVNEYEDEKEWKLALISVRVQLSKTVSADSESEKLDKLIRSTNASTLLADFFLGASLPSEYLSTLSNDSSSASSTTSLSRLLSTFEFAGSGEILSKSAGGVGRVGKAVDEEAGTRVVEERGGFLAFWASS